MGLFTCTGNKTRTISKSFKHKNLQISRKTTNHQLKPKNQQQTNIVTAKYIN
jgi:hypothetical protein